MHDEDQPARAEYPAEIARVGSQLPLSPQEKAIAELHDTIGQLTNRLKSVLTPMSDTDRKEPGNEPKSQSPLAEQLTANNRGIHRASQKLRELMEKLEC